MKKLQFLTITALITMFSINATLNENGFSDIRADNPREKEQRLKASDDRIAEEFSPLNAESFEAFLAKTEDLIKNLQPKDKKSGKGKGSRNKDCKQSDLKIAIAATVDLFRSYNQLEESEKHDDFKDRIDALKAKLLTFNLGRMKMLLEDMAQ